MSDTESQMLRTEEHLDDLDAQIAAMELAAQEAEEKAWKEQEEHGKRLAAMKAAAEEKKRKAEEEKKRVEEERWKAEEEARKQAEEQVQERAEEEARKKVEEAAAEDAWKKAAVAKGKGKARADSPLSSPENQPTRKRPRQQVVVELPARVGELGPSWRTREYSVINMVSKSGSSEEEESKPGGPNPCWRCRKGNHKCKKNPVKGKFPCLGCENKHLGCGEEPAPKKKRRVVNRSDTGSVWSEESVGRIGALVEVVRGIQTDLGQILGRLEQISGGMRAIDDNIKFNGTLLKALAQKNGVLEEEILKAYKGESDKREKRSERPEDRPESSDAPESEDEEDEEEDEVQGEVRRGGMEVDE